MSPSSPSQLFLLRCSFKHRQIDMARNADLASHRMQRILYISKEDQVMSCEKQKAVTLRCSPAQPHLFVCICLQHRRLQQSLLLAFWGQFTTLLKSLWAWTTSAPCVSGGEHSGLGSPPAPPQAMPSSPKCFTTGGGRRQILGSLQEHKADCKLYSSLINDLLASFSSYGSSS